MKLSKAQTEVMNKAKKDIDLARSLDYPEWLRTTHSYYQIPNWADEELKEHIDNRWKKAVDEKYLYEYWENARNSIVLTSCNTRTLKKLESYGLIEIIYDSTGELGGIDTVKVLKAE